MKISRICLVVALVMALFVAWTVATPMQLNGSQLIGGCNLGSCDSNTEEYPCVYSQCGTFHTCLGPGPRTCYSGWYCESGPGCGAQTRQSGSNCLGG